MTIDELRELAENERTRQKQYISRILYCSSAGCLSGGCDSVKAEFKKAIEEKGLGKTCELVGTGCLGLCGEGPLVLVQSTDMTLYQHVDAKTARRIVEEHIVSGKKVEEYQIDVNGPFFSSQKKIVLENMGKINAESIEEYIAAGGYEALAKAVTEMKPEELIG